VRRGNASLALCLGLAVGGCSFDVSGLGGDDDDDDDVVGDDGGADGAGDAGPCAEPLQATLAIDGFETGTPRTRVLVGDTVTLSATGSCSLNGPLSYQWLISPIDNTRETAIPNLTAATLTVYPVLPRTYIVELTVDDGVDSVTVDAELVAYGFAEQDGVDNDVRDLDVGGGRLWVATRTGAFRSNGLVDPMTFVEIHDEVEGNGEDTLPSGVDTVYYEEDEQAVWLGNKDIASGVHRVDYNGDDTPVANLIHYDGFTALGTFAETHDIAGFDDGVVVATSTGMVSAPDGANPVFGDLFRPFEFSLFAAADRDGLWAGGTRVYRPEGGGPFDPFDEGDDKVRVLKADPFGGELWVGTDGFGIATLDAEGETIAIYDEDTSHLTAEKIRAIAIEPAGRFAGDVWVATDRGIARFKRDQGIWLTYGNTEGLMGNLDVRGIAIDVDVDAGRRTIWGGVNGGLVYIRTP
jgi:ligand-binding sensor domain-containing protein